MEWHVKIGKLGLPDKFVDGTDAVEVGCLYASGRVVEVGDPVPAEWFGYPATCSLANDRSPGKYCIVADNVFLGIKEEPVHPVLDARTGRVLVDEDGDEVELVNEFSEVKEAVDQRVGPVDVERVILEHDAVEEVGVVVTGGGRVVAFVKLRPDEEYGLDSHARIEQEIKERVEKALDPAYSPRVVFLPFRSKTGLVLASIPKTLAGKVKRSELVKFT
ncbi:MAG: hypothetical protein Kow0069_07050 [Promethearchaeota archaeon]